MENIKSAIQIKNMLNEFKSELGHINLSKLNCARSIKRSAYFNLNIEVGSSIKPNVHAPVDKCIWETI